MSLETIWGYIQRSHEYREDLLDLPFAAVATCVYFFGILLIKYLMTNRQPVEALKPLMSLHNLTLTIFSLVTAVGVAYTVWDRATTFGWKSVYCQAERGQPNQFTGTLWALCFAYYQCKFVEFIDTIFIVLRKKELTFLHFYHHTVIVPLTLAYLYYDAVVLWTGVLLNAIVHTIMYWLFFLISVGEDPWWKRYVTQIQIVQFIVGLALLWPYPYICDYSLAWESLPMRPWFFQQLIIFSFFILFSQFYQRRYPDKKKETKTE